MRDVVCGLIHLTIRWFYHVMLLGTWHNWKVESVGCYEIMWVCKLQQVGGWHKGAFDTLFAKIRAINFGLHAIISNVHMLLVVELDNLTTMQLLNGEDDLLTLVKSMIEDILYMGMQYRIQFWHIWRSQNLVAVGINFIISVIISLIGFVIWLRSILPLYHCSCLSDCVSNKKEAFWIVLYQLGYLRLIW